MTLTGKYKPYFRDNDSNVLLGIIHNYQGLLATRFFLGIPEAGIFPACAYYVTSWYPRHEAQYRTALFYASASFAYVLLNFLPYLAWIYD